MLFGSTYAKVCWLNTLYLNLRQMFDLKLLFVCLRSLTFSCFVGNVFEVSGSNAVFDLINADLWPQNDYSAEFLIISEKTLGMIQQNINYLSEFSDFINSERDERFQSRNNVLEWRTIGDPL